MNDADAYERSDHLYRTGIELLAENAFGRGGDLRVDVEYNERESEVPDDDDFESEQVRFDRLSYAWGGTRFAPQRFELGRHFQQDMPEFGVIDGASWSRRLDSGQRFGASLGWMPEPNEEYDSGEDFQGAAWYRWVADESEQTAASAGYQKTFHDGSSDRDLFVAKFQRLPIDGWRVNGTAWIDLYGSDDDAKGSGLALTQAQVVAGRRWEEGRELDLAYTHLEIPEIDRFEFIPPSVDELADDRLDRLAVDGRMPVGRERRVYGGVGVWSDEHDDGGDAQLGIEIDELFFEHSEVDLALFGSSGRFSSLIGGRAGLGGAAGAATWWLGYEYTQNHVLDFGDDNDDLPQQRVHGRWSLNTVNGWSFNLQAQFLMFDDEDAWSAGVHLQKSF
jgi:hypothetical protein